ncbi:MAG TPA: hypothetical protein VME46_00615 [Acidimicrobiales bacterium]|nr:hypothetical protein [Acidimicrobiales bacterium]
MREQLELTSADGNLTAGVDPRTGSLVRLRCDQLDWEVLGEARGARPFDLLLPLAQRRRNRTRDIAQASPRVQTARGANSVEMVWEEVRAEAGTALAVEVSVTYSVDEQGLVCNLTVTNHSDVVVEDVAFPCLTDLQPLPGQDQLDFFTYEYGGARKQRLRPFFDNVPRLLRGGPADRAPAAPRRHGPRQPFRPARGAGWRPVRGG